VHTSDRLFSIYNGYKTECVLEQAIEKEGYTCQVATDLREVEKLGPVWKSWTSSVDADFEYYLHNLRNDSTILYPYVLVVRQAGIVQTILVGQVKEQKVSTIIAFVNIHGPRAKILEIVNQGRLGRRSPVIDKLLATQLFKELERGIVDVLSFDRLPLRSDLFREIQQFSGFLRKVRVCHIFGYTQLSLPGQTARCELVLSKKMKREVKRKERILHRAFPGNVQYRCFSRPGTIELGLHDAQVVALTTWQHSVEPGFLNTREAAENLRFCASNGWLRVYVLYVGDLPCSFLVGQLYRDIFYCKYAGYDPDYGRFSVGAALTAWALEDLARVGARSIDLGEGGQEHNRRLGCRFVQQGTVHVYASTLRGLWARLFFDSSWLIRLGGRMVLTGLQLNWTLKLWQRLLIARRICRPAR
jgi:Acetyltransferase (GNAT) domain